MPHCAKCGSQLRSKLCPRCDSATQATPAESGPSLMTSLVMLLVGGLVSIFLAPYILDQPGLELLCMVLCIGPIFFHYAAVRTDWGKSRVTLIATIVRVAAVILVMLAAFLVGNSALDRAPVEHVEARVVNKYEHTGKSSYRKLRVAMLWREAVHVETLDVASDTYRLANIGGAVIVDIHPGYFYLPWYRVTNVVAPQPAP